MPGAVRTGFPHPWGKCPKDKGGAKPNPGTKSSPKSQITEHMPILSDESCIEIRQRLIDLGSKEVEQSIIEHWSTEFGCSTNTIENIINDRSYRRPECYPAGPQRDAAIQRDADWKEQKRLRRNAKARERYTTRKYRDQVLERDNHRCVYCHADLKIVTAHIDHRIPLDDGGSQDLNNLQATCPNCNRRKKAYSPNEFPCGEVGIATYLWRRHLVDVIMEIASETDCWARWDKWTRDSFEQPLYRLCWNPENEKSRLIDEDHVEIFRAALDNDLGLTRKLVIEHITKADEMVSMLQERDHWIEHAYCGDGDKWHDGACEDN